MVNKKRLIDIDVLKGACRETLMVDVFPNWRNMSNKERNVAVKLGAAFRRIHDNVPTVDAVEVVHGHTVVRERNRGVIRYIPCPFCSSAVPSNKPYTEKVEYCSVCGKKLDDTFQNYCPNCGAKMDGGVDE